METQTSQNPFENIDPYMVIDSVSHPERRKFDPWLTVDDIGWTKPIYDECFPLGGTNRHRQTFDTIALNLAVSADPMSVCLDKSHYRKQSKPPKGFTPTNISPIFRELERRFFVDIIRGYKYVKNTVSSTVQPTDKLLDLVPDGLHYAIQREGLIRYKKLDVPDPLPEQDQWGQEVLFRYNQKTEPENQLYRTRKDSLENDGRFTGSKIQRLSKDERRKLKMDTEETFESDVSNCLPSLLYAMKLKCRCPEDAYNLPGVPRSLAKRALLIMLNTKRRTTAIKAVQQMINGSTHRGFKASEIIEALERKHHRVREFFYVEEGRRLMSLESSCMCKLLEELSFRDIEVYPIYDAVIGRVSEQCIIDDLFHEAFTVNGVEPRIH